MGEGMTPELMMLREAKTFIEARSPPSTERNDILFRIDLAIAAAEEETAMPGGIRGAVIRWLKRTKES
jgi:hypothetical protein